MKIRLNFWIILALLVALAGGQTAPVQAQNALADEVCAITVTNANDSGAGSLRQAILDICSGGDITFDGDYTIHLASELYINKGVNINGSGHNITLSGDTDGGGSGDVRVFYLISGVRVRLDFLTITKGYADQGGGMYISPSASISIFDSQFIDNQANQGGAFYNNGGSATIRRSFFSGNHASANGGAIFEGNPDYSGSTYVINSTFSGNSAGGSGGAIYVKYSLSTQLCTFSENSAAEGGAIYTFGSTRLFGTILANNPVGGNCAPTDPSISDGGGNFVWGDTTCPFTNADPKLGPLGNYGGPSPTYPLLPGSAALDVFSSGTEIDQRGVARPQGAGGVDSGAFESYGFTLSNLSGSDQSTAASTAFASPLGLTVTANNPVEPVDGGQVTFTPPASGASAALTGSPAAISGGLASVTAQANATPGAYDVTASTAGAASAAFHLTNTNACAITVTNANDSGDGSLRQAIDYICPGGTITFDGDYTIHLASELSIGKTVNIDGTGHSVTLSGDTDGDGSGDVRVFNLYSSLKLYHLTLTKGSADQGGAIFVHPYAGLAAYDSIFTNNQADQGGAIYNDGGHPNIIRSFFSGNHASANGGAIFEGNPDYSGSTSVTNSTFSGNSAGGNGGAVYVEYNFRAAYSTFSENSAAAGGGIYGFGVTTLNGTILANNPAGGNCAPADPNILDSGGNIVWGDTTCPFTNADPKLGPLGNYGGSSPTYPLLPGSAAIDVNNSTGTDQRDVIRPQGSGSDSGAFESQGFTLGSLSGSDQSAAASTAFASPLGLTVTANNPVEPVDGGQVTFTPPASGASAALTGSPAAISGGQASVTAQANATPGAYDVTASAAGAASTAFHLTNTGSAPGVTVQPQNLSVTAGATASFSAAANGEPTPTVQWQVSSDHGATWGDLSGETAATLAFTAQIGQNGYQYRAVFTNLLGTATSNAATLTVTSASTAIITSSSTTCSQFAAGTAADLTEALYTVKSGKINSVTPGSFLYYSKVTAPSSSFQIKIKQTNDQNWTFLSNNFSLFSSPFSLYNASCRQQNLTVVMINSTITFYVSHATPGATYYVGIRYQADSLKGKRVSSPYPTTQYQLVTSLNNTSIPQSTDVISIRPQ